MEYIDNDEDGKGTVVEGYKASRLKIRISRIAAVHCPGGSAW